MFGGERNKFVAAAREERIGGDQKHPRPGADQGFESNVDVSVAPTLPT